MMTNYTWHKSLTSLSGVSKALIIAAALFVAACGERVSREDFATQVQDKSMTEVQKRHGKPDSVDESDAGKVKWIYTSKTFSTGDSTKMDSKTVVVFTKTDANAAGKVIEVLYQ